MWTILQSLLWGNGFVPDGLSTGLDGGVAAGDNGRVRGRAAVKGQIALKLPPEMLRRSEAWRARRDERAAVRAEFDEARRHGLMARHAEKLRRLDVAEWERQFLPPGSVSAREDRMPGGLAGSVPPARRH